MNIILSLLLLIIIAMLSYFTYALTEVLSTGQGLFGLGLVTVGGGIIFVSFLLMIYYFNVQQKYQLKNEILEKYNEQQKKYFELLLEKEQKTRQFRHDIIAELIQIKNLSLKKDYNGLEKYITETLKEISFISKYDYDVGNDTVNTILNYYLLPVKNRCKIEVNGYLSDSITVSDRDLCIVISNLIVNAIEAVDKVYSSERNINVTLKKGKIFTYIIIKNTFVNSEDKVIQNKISTTKSDKRNHGFGLKNVKNIVEKYNGELVLKVEKNQFIAEIRIKN
ncbi:MAG: GHKL domain-containing protein [Lachnospiraceae bacterium]|nr:GHKL domain-containing protein [Lachnospiraceae bacterium]